MKALGIDPGLANLGLAVVERIPNSYRAIEAVNVTTQAGQSDDQRYAVLFQAVSRAIRQHHPLVVSIELQLGVAAGKRMQGNEPGQGWFAANAKVDEVVGMVKGACLAYGAPWIMVTPMTVKVAILGPGNKSASKDDVKKRAAMFYPGRLSKHAADAIAIAIAGMQRWSKERIVIDQLERSGRLPLGVLGARTHLT